MKGIEKMNDFDRGYFLGIVGGFVSLMATIILVLLIGRFLPGVLDNFHTNLIMLLAGIPILFYIIIEINMKYGESPDDSSKDDSGV